MAIMGREVSEKVTLSFRTEQSECEESFSRIEQGKISPVGRNDKREKVEMIGKSAKMTKDRLK